LIKLYIYVAKIKVLKRSDRGKW